MKLTVENAESVEILVSIDEEDQALYTECLFPNGERRVEAHCVADRRAK